MTWPPWAQADSDSARADPTGRWLARAWSRAPTVGSAADGHAGRAGNGRDRRRRSQGRRRRWRVTPRLGREQERVRRDEARRAAGRRRRAVPGDVRSHRTRAARSLAAHPGLAADTRTGDQVAIAGRVMLLRDHGTRAVRDDPRLDRRPAGDARSDRRTSSGWQATRRHRRPRRRRRRGDHDEDRRADGRRDARGR